MDNYIINSDTLAIIPIGFNKSRVLELDNEFVINTNPTKIIKNSCLYFGSSLEGRMEGTKYLLNCHYKLPILLSEFNNLIAFPTLSFKSNDCCWLILNNIKEYYKDNKTTNIVFDNNKMININTTLSSFENQFFRSIRFKELLNKNRK